MVHRDKTCLGNIYTYELSIQYYVKTTDYGMSYGWKDKTLQKSQLVINN